MLVVSQLLIIGAFNGIFASEIMDKLEYIVKKDFAKRDATSG